MASFCPYSWYTKLQYLDYDLKKHVMALYITYMNRSSCDIDLRRLSYTSRSVTEYYGCKTARNSWGNLEFEYPPIHYSWLAGWSAVCSTATLADARILTHMYLVVNPLCLLPVTAVVWCQPNFLSRRSLKNWLSKWSLRKTQGLLNPENLGCAVPRVCAPKWIHYSPL